MSEAKQNQHHVSQMRWCIPSCTVCFLCVFVNCNLDFVFCSLPGVFHPVLIPVRFWSGILLLIIDTYSLECISDSLCSCKDIFCHSQDLVYQVVCNFLEAF